MVAAWPTLAVIVLGFAGSGEERPELAALIKLRAAGQPIDVGGQGHAAPFVGDFDGDGVNDLLVGQFDDGKLRVYRNIGTNAEPRFGDFTWFKAGTGRVPTG